MILAKSLNIIAQRGIPAGVVAVAFVQGCSIIILPVGITASPLLGLDPVTAQVKLGLGCKAFDDLPGQTCVQAYSIAIAKILVVIDNTYRIVIVLSTGTTHSQI